MAPKHFGIAGAGIAGLSFGILALLDGHKVDIFDQFEKPLAVGSGFVLQAVSFAVLDEMGILDDVLKYGAELSGLHGREANSDQVILDVRFRKGRFGIGIQRATIHSILLKRYKELGGQLNMGLHVSSLEASKIITENGQSFGGFDLLIDARGSGALRSFRQKSSLKYGALWWNVPTKDNSKWLRQRYLGASNMLGLMPMNTHPNNPTPQSAMFWSLKCSDYEEWMVGDFSQWKEEAANIWPEFGDNLENVKKEEIHFSEYIHDKRKTPYQDNCVCLGDSQQASSPQLGQGANMAILDSFTLIWAFRTYGFQDGPMRYAKARKMHREFYQFASFLFTPLYQSDSRFLAGIRNYILAPLSINKLSNVVLERLVLGNIVTPIYGEKRFFDKGIENAIGKKMNL